ncbi:MAG: phasin family protein [Betaproteobacteria bacterium]|nr:phasin family protein [Betaproteobacteria bacterium]
MIKIDQFSAANEAAINQFAHFAQLSLANLEKFAEIGLDAARDSVEQATAHAAALAGAKDVHEVIAINSAALEPVMKRAYSYSRTVYETAAETNAEVKKVLEKQATDANKSAVSNLEEAFKYAPAGSEAYVGNVKSAMAAAQNAYANLTAINKQLYDTVEKTVEQNVATVRSATTAPKAPVRKAKRK